VRRGEVLPRIAETIAVPFQEDIGWQVLEVMEEVGSAEEAASELRGLPVEGVPWYLPGWVQRGWDVQVV